MLPPESGVVVDPELLEAGPESELPLDPELPERELEPELPLDPELEPDPEPEIEPESEPEVEPEGAPELDVELRPDEPELEAELVADESKPDPEPDPEPDPPPSGDKPPLSDCDEHAARVVTVAATRRRERARMEILAFRGGRRLRARRLRTPFRARHIQWMRWSASFFLNVATHLTYVLAEMIGHQRRLRPRRASCAPRRSPSTLSRKRRGASARYRTCAHRVRCGCTPKQRLRRVD